jgi:outer membrane protein OmpA-like peptidoglycan-associated protein
MSLSMIRRALLALLLIPLPIAAQGPGPVELGGFLQWSVFDGSLQMDDFFAEGARAGVFLTRALAIEADVARTSTNGPPGVRVTYWPLHARLVYNHMLPARVTAMLGLGAVHNEYGGARNAKDNGLSALFGVRIPVASQFALRLDVNADFMPSPANQSGTVRDNWNFGVREGLSIMLGRQKPKPDSQDVPHRPEPQPPAASTVQDSDHDGVNDQLDRCPNSATGTRVDASGCPVDSDGDGVADSYDRCPNTPAGTQVDSAGCLLDGDSDGVPNSLDRCPDTPAGTVVGSSGCALDTDGDGVPDAIDRCPGTSAGTRVDASGCLLLFDEKRKSLILEGVNFADARAELTPESAYILDNVAASLLANDKVRVVVEGHTSSTGTRVFNLGLSWARAAAVREYLIARAVAPDRLVARGFGPDRPIASNATAEGQARNRRVELRQMPEEQPR